MSTRNERLTQSRRGNTAVAPKRHPRATRLGKELQNIQKSIEMQHVGYSVDLIDDQLDEWRVKLSRKAVDPDSQLRRDMIEKNVDHIELNFSFPEDYPISPPFVRVVQPKLRGGHVYEGAICLELLTKKGWSCSYCVEAIIVQVSSLFSHGGARIEDKGKFDKLASKKYFDHIEETHTKNGWRTAPLSDG